MAMHYCFMPYGKNSGKFSDKISKNRFCDLKGLQESVPLLILH